MIVFAGKRSPLPPPRAMKGNASSCTSPPSMTTAQSPSRSWSARWDLLRRACRCALRTSDHLAVHGEDDVGRLLEDRREDVLAASSGEPPARAPSTRRSSSPRSAIRRRPRRSRGALLAMAGASG
jgi:hypothetical protein